MQYVISCKQPKEYLLKSDMIMVTWEERQNLMELGHRYSNKTFILNTGYENLDVQELLNYKKFCHNNLICEISDYEQMIICQGIELKYYFSTFLTSFESALNAKENGACFLKISSPLTNNLEKVKKIGLPLLAVLNSTYNGFPNSADNVCGNWFRPEDYDYYSKYIDIGLFAWRDLGQERAFYRIYAEKHEWIGNLKDIIFGIKQEGKNHLIPKTLAEKRGSCDQACKKNGTCALCDHTLQLAKPDLLKQIKRKNQEK